MKYNQAWTPPPSARERMYFMDTTSITLLEQLRVQPDDAAWNRLVQLYTPLLFSWAQKAGLQAHDAADLVQDVFTVLLQTLPTFHYDPKGRFRGWLKTITCNKLRDRKRRAALAQQQPLEQCPEPALADTAEELWEREYHKELTQRALQLIQADFAPTTWQACWEFVAKGRPASEIAHELGISENAVYLARCRVLRRLRTELSGLLE
jgi:RNA polymerase sigma-70 factor (ECF subfamily)